MYHIETVYYSVLSESRYTALQANTYYPAPFQITTFECVCFTWILFLNQCSAVHNDNSTKDNYVVAKSFAKYSNCKNDEF